MDPREVEGEIYLDIETLRLSNEVPEDSLASKSSESPLPSPGICKVNIAPGTKMMLPT